MSLRDERIQLLQKHKLFRTETLSPHFKKLIEKHENTHIKELLIAYNGSTWTERVWRFVHDDNSLKYCKANCGSTVKFFETYRDGFRTYCSKKCVDRPNFTFAGKTHSDATKKQMSLNHSDFTGDKNPFRNSLKNNPQKRKEHSDRAITRWKKRDKQWRSEFSRKLSMRPLSQAGGGRGFTGHQRGIHKSSKVKNGEFWYRSSWELEFAKKLDTCDLVQRYEVEQIRIQYETDIGIRFTYVDFHLFTESGFEAIVEIKPQLISELKQEKILEQVKWCIKNEKQFAIIDLKIITNHFNELIEIINNGEINAGKFIGSRPITPEITSKFLGI
jgi:hypothetical protein